MDLPDAGHEVDHELRASGEVVDSKHLTDRTRATTVRFTGGATRADGPFAEIKESLAGYWIVDSTRERALDIASQVVARISGRRAGCRWDGGGPA